MHANDDLGIIECIEHILRGHALDCQIYEAVITQKIFNLVDIRRFAIIYISARDIDILVSNAILSGLESGRKSDLASM